MFYCENYKRKLNFQWACWHFIYLLFIRYQLGYITTRQNNDDFNCYIKFEKVRPLTWDRPKSPYGGGGCTDMKCV